MGAEYYIIPVLFWLSIAAIGAGLVAAVMLVIDFIKFDLQLGKYKQEVDEHGDSDNWR